MPDKSRSDEAKMTYLLDPLRVFNVNLRILLSSSMVCLSSARPQTCMACVVQLELCHALGQHASKHRDHS
jgi:hypothetical protein